MQGNTDDRADGHVDGRGHADEITRVRGRRRGSWNGPVDHGGGGIDRLTASEETGGVGGCVLEGDLAGGRPESTRPEDQYEDDRRKGEREFGSH